MKNAKNGKTNTSKKQANNSTPNVQTSKKTEDYGRKLNVPAIFSVLRHQKKGTALNRETLLQELNSYGFELNITNISRIMGGICYSLLVYRNDKSNEKDINDLFPFFLHAEIGFDKCKDVNLEEKFYDIFRLCVKETKNKQLKDLTIEDKKKICETITEFFPLTTSGNGTNIEKMDLHFPLHYQECKKDSDIMSQLPSDVDISGEYIEFLSVFFKPNDNGYYFPNDTLYYIEEERLNEQELKMIMDSIEVYSYISKEDTENIIQKLEKLNSPVLYNSYEMKKYPDKVEKLNPQNSKMFFENLKTIEECIENRLKMWLVYGEYQYVQTITNERKILLQPRQGYRMVDNGGEEKIGEKLVSPYHIMWANGFYYAIVLFEGKENLASIRIDRILDVCKAEPKNGIETKAAPLPAGYDFAKLENTDKISSQKFMNMAVVMHAEKPTKVTFCCKKFLLNNVIDGFGFDIKVKNISDATGEEWLEVTSEHASISGSALWLTQHCAGSYAVAPEELKQKVVENLKRGQSYYPCC